MTVSVQKARLHGLDAVKAAGIACVVLIHAAPVEPAWYQRHVVDGLARLGVPVFLVTTGFLAGWHAWSRLRLRRGALRFLQLHLVWALFHWVREILRKGWPDPWSWWAALLHFGEGAYPGQFYFAILVQVLLFAGLCLPEGGSRRPTTVALSAVAALGGIALLHAASDLAVARWAWRPLKIGSVGWLWFYYFSLGAWLGDRARSGEGALARLGLRGAAGLVLAAIALAASGWPRLPGFDDPSATPYARLSVYLASTLFALSLPALAAREVPAVVQRVGAATFGIFVLNPALLGLGDDFLGPAGSLLDSWLRAAVTIAAAVPITDFLRRRARWLVA